MKRKKDFSKKVIILSVLLYLVVRVLFNHAAPLSKDQRYLSLLSLYPPNFMRYEDVDERQKAFINYIFFFAKIINRQIAQERNRIILLERKFDTTSRLSSREKRWLKKSAANYRLSKWEPNSKADFTKLLRRVDLVPFSLLIAQAATESAWGTSRFAIYGNNLFGQHCFVKGCGILRRGEKVVRYQFKRFPSVLAGMEGYVMNLNSFIKYRYFRTLREGERRAKRSYFSGNKLAEGLLYYSVLREGYITKIRQVIDDNDLDYYDREMKLIYPSVQ